MPEIVDLLTENEQPIVRKVFRTLQRRLREQNGLSLGYLWRSTLRTAVHRSDWARRNATFCATLQTT